MTDASDLVPPDDAPLSDVWARVDGIMQRDDESDRDWIVRLRDHFAPPSVSAWGGTWCQPRDDAGGNHRTWMVLYAEPGMGRAVFTGPDAERDARDHFRRADAGWTCALYATAPALRGTEAPPTPTFLDIVEEYRAAIDGFYAGVRGFGRTLPRYNAPETRRLHHAVEALTAALAEHRGRRWTIPVPPESQGQVAAVMALHGTPAQQAEADAFLRGQKITGSDQALDRAMDVFYARNVRVRTDRERVSATIEAYINAKTKER